MRVLVFLMMLVAGPAMAAQASAVFAGGCFWCTEADFEKLDGVSEAISGYAGGEEVDPTYQQVAGGQTGHTEVVKVLYDPEVVSYENLLAWFWKHIDPTDPDGQFIDQGSSTAARSSTRTTRSVRWRKRPKRPSMRAAVSIRRWSPRSCR